jgi:dihydroorotase
MGSTLIINAKIVNEGRIQEGDLRIRGPFIENIGKQLNARHTDTVVDALGGHLIPGMIDDQVHFREPGLTHKGTIASESRAAVAGGITSYMEMPNVSPPTTTLEALDEKYQIAAEHSLANFAFYLGATEDNLNQITALNPKRHCGVKVFMGASTGDLLVEAPQVLEAIFRESPVLIATHCESGAVIGRNRTALHSTKRRLSIEDHPMLRDAEACYASSSYAVDLARRHESQLHVLHITTERELALFEPGPVEGKRITAEACVHHLWFSDQDYPRSGNLIKCNPAIKTARDRDALIHALHTGQIDIVATDHAPHTWNEKQAPYEQAPAGLPLVEHALLSLLDHVKLGRLGLTQVVEKTAHNPARRYGIEGRGFIREGYYADLVLLDTEQSTFASHQSARSLCGWTPFHGYRFSAAIKSTWVNGRLVFNDHMIIDHVISSQPLSFNQKI